MKRILLCAMAMTSVFAFGQTHFSADFEGGDLSGWTTVDSDGDGINWTTLDASGNFAELGSFTATSRSWTNADGPLNPDNLLISDSIDLSAVSPNNLFLYFTSGTIEGAPYHAEKYAVYVTTSSAPADIMQATPVFTETLSTPAAVSAQIINLSAYAGDTVFLTFRHYDTYDMNTLLIDNIQIKTLLDDDASLADITTPAYIAPGMTTVSGTITNEGGNAITSVTLEYTINGGTAVSE